MNNCSDDDHDGQKKKKREKKSLKTFNRRGSVLFRLVYLVEL
jgi:hypothetical protein